MSSSPNKHLYQLKFSKRRRGGVRLIEVGEEEPNEKQKQIEDAFSLLTYDNPDIIGEEEIKANPNIYKEALQYFFGRYLEGMISLEEFVQIKSAPKYAFDQLKERKEKKETSKLFGAAFKKLYSRGETNIADNPERKHKKFGFIHSFYYDMIEKVKKERRPDICRYSDEQVKDRILKLRKFLKEKKKETQMKNCLYSGTVFFEFVVSLADNALRKIKRKNLIDYFDIDQEVGKMKNKNCKNFSLRSKGKHSYEIDKVDKITAKIRLNKIMKQIDKGSSTYVESVKQMFNKTSDFYYEHLRPVTPPKYKEKLKIKTDTALRLAKIKRNQQPSPSPGKKRQTVLFAPTVTGEAKSSRNITISNDLSYALSSNNSSTYEKKLEKRSSTHSKLTFNSRIRSQKTSSKEAEYAYFKERRLLEFLKLSKMGNTEHNKLINQKIDNLVKKNKGFEQEKQILSEKLKAFNPSNTEAIERYLDATQQNNV